MFLILIDAHSKWIEAYETASATSTVVMQELRTTFARFGLPETIVTDNGTCFVSSKFEEFLQKNGIRHITSAPYHPASNGLAEQAVQIVKKKGSRWLLRVAFLIDLLMCCYPIGFMPQGTTGRTPSKILLGRRPRTKLDLVKPHTAERVEKKQRQQKSKHDSTARAQTFQMGDHVWFKNFRSGEQWIPGSITGKVGKCYFLSTVKRWEDMEKSSRQLTTSTETRCTKSRYQSRPD